MELKRRRERIKKGGISSTLNNTFYNEMRYNEDMLKFYNYYKDSTDFMYLIANRQFYFF